MPEYIEVIPLGGLGEFGMNCSAIRHEAGLILIDAGMTFPRNDLGGELGVNVVVPDIAFLRESPQRLGAIFLTHGHEDHVGAVSYILDRIPTPVYGSRLTLGLVEQRLKERGLLDSADLRPIKEREKIEIDGFVVEPLRVTHSFPEAFAYAIETPAGRIIWTGDFKFDQSPSDGYTTDMSRLSEYGDRGTLALFSDSTNSQTSGLSPSESTVEEPLRNCFRRASGRIVLSCFSSSIHRIQTVLDLAAEFDRKVVVAGRSLSQNIHITTELGYLTVPDDVLTRASLAKGLAPERLVILASGSQGEPMSAMSRLAVEGYKGLRVEKGDLVVLSARIIPGNEKKIASLANHFCRRGAQVVDSKNSGVHASGHGFQEDLKLMMSLTKPRYFIPIHGDFRQLTEHARLAREQGIDEDRVQLIENGEVLRLDEDSARVVDQVTAGRRFIDEGHAGEVHELVLRDRRYLSEDGFLVIVLRMDRFESEPIGDPELISRGFVLMDESEDLMDRTGAEILEIIEATASEEIADEELFKEILRKGVRRFLRKQTGKRPMILPVIIEI